MSNTKLVFFLKPESFKGWLMKVMTGCYAYHCGILMEDTQMFYDMFWMRRRKPWKEVEEGVTHCGAVYKIIDSPVEISEDYLVQSILDKNTFYGVKDYAFFALRWAYHLFGKTTRNADGMICSEMVYHDLLVHKWGAHFPEVPSPCCLIKALEAQPSHLAFGPSVSEELRLTLTTLSKEKVV